MRLLLIKYGRYSLGWFTFTTAQFVSGSNVKKYWDFKAELV